MRQHLMLGAAFILIGCVSGPSKQDLAEDRENFEFVRGCGEATGVSRSIVEYECKHLGCRFKTCYIKTCGGGVELSKIELSETECKAELKVDKEAQ